MQGQDRPARICTYAQDRTAQVAFGVAADRRDGDHGLTGTICDRPGRCEPLTALRPRLDTVLDQIRAAMPPGAHVLVTSYWNAFLDDQVGAAKGTAYVANSDALTRAVNADLAAAAADTGMHYIDLYTPFKGDGSRETPRCSPQTATTPTPPDIK